MFSPFRLPGRAAACALVLPAALAQAQQAPDAGQTLQQQQPVPQLPRTGPTINLQVPTAPPAPAGGAQVLVQSISIAGNTVFSEAELMAVLGDYAGQSYDLAGLRGLAERISAFYRAKGYPFARAYLPPQTAAAGKLRIEVLEGRYGQVHALGEKALADAATGFLAPLKPGEVIRSDKLERTTLILDDQPGIRVAPIIRPGQEVGTGDLDVRMERTAGLSGDVGVDNYGNRYTGQFRARGNLNINSPFMLGDQVNLRLLGTEENLWLGSLGYHRPLGTSGLRGQVSYAHTQYQLGGAFANLKATGFARVATLGATYPLLRSQRANLTAGVSWQQKALHDRQEFSGADNRKSSESTSLTLSFDRRDQLLGGGITYGAVSLTAGQLTLDSTLQATDQASAQTEGTFVRTNLDIARLQSVNTKVQLFGRASAQLASKNLDSSERFGLGGPTGVRAYPVGESFGDQGWLVQLEARYWIGAYAPYVFYDAGEIRTNVKPWQAGVNERFISGTGIGTRWNQGAWQLDGALAWRLAGGKPESDTRDDRPTVWVNASYRF